METNAARGALAVFLLASVLLGFVLRTWVVFRRTGINPFVLPATDDLAGYVGRGLRLAGIGAAVVMLCAAAGARTTGWLGPLPAWPLAASAVGGWLLLAGALGVLVTAQVQMGASWRIGIDAKHATALVTHGLFGWSRNPIFLAVRAIMLGLFLLIPAAIPLALLAAAEVLIQVQVRLEEAHLSAQHGTAYAAYRAQVGRWFGRGAGVLRT